MLPAFVAVCFAACGARFVASEISGATSSFRRDRGLCLQPLERGNCSKRIVQFFYNPVKNRCRKFIYSGCGGNENRFSTRFECRMRCARLKHRSSTTFLTKNRSRRNDCTLCDKRFATCVAGECRCQRGFWGDGITCEDVNECENGVHQCAEDAYCLNTAGSYRCECQLGYAGSGTQCTKNPEVCEQSFEGGYEELCDATAQWEVRYYFDSEAHICQRFWYGGCVFTHNQNIFADAQSCEALCMHRSVGEQIMLRASMESSEAAEHIADLCADPFDRALERPCSGSAWQPRFFYNSSTSRCEMFWFDESCETTASGGSTGSGSGSGTRNIFGYLSTCRRLCEPDTVSNEVAPLPSKRGAAKTVGKITAMFSKSNAKAAAVGRRKSAEKPENFTVLNTSKASRTTNESRNQAKVRPNSTTEKRKKERGKEKEKMREISKNPGIHRRERPIARDAETSSVRISKVTATLNELPKADSTINEPRWLRGKDPRLWNSTFENDVRFDDDSGDSLYARVVEKRKEEKAPMAMHIDARFQKATREVAELPHIAHEKLHKKTAQNWNETLVVQAEAMSSSQQKDRSMISNRIRPHPNAIGEDVEGSDVRAQLPPLRVSVHVASNRIPTDGSDDRQVDGVDPNEITDDSSLDAAQQFSLRFSTTLAVAVECLDTFDEGLTRSCGDGKWTARYYFDADRRVCQMFWNDGCRSLSRNNFDDLATCQWKCEGTHPVPHARSCLDVFDPTYLGDCRNGNFEKRYYFNHNRKRCELFFYGGCPSTSRNFFFDYGECTELCENPGRELLRACLQPFDRNYERSCSTDFSYRQQYYFDRDSRQCRMFWYGNCRGSSENIFPSLAICQWICERKKDDQAPSSSFFFKKIKMLQSKPYI